LVVKFSDHIPRPHPDPLLIKEREIRSIERGMIHCGIRGNGTGSSSQ